MNNRELVAKGIYLETIAKIALVVCGFIINILLARKLGPTQYGYLGTIASLLFIVEIFVTNGVRQAISKFVSASKVDVRALWKNAAIAQMAVCLILLLIFGFSMNAVSSWLEIEPYKNYLYVIFFIIPIEGAFYVNLGFLNGFLYYKDHALSNLIYSVTRMVIIISVLYLINNGILAVLTGTFIGYIVGFIFSGIQWGKHRDTGGVQVPVKSFLSATFGILAFYLLVNIFLNLDVLLLSGLGAAKELVGNFKTDTSIGVALYFFFMSFSEVSYPMFSKLYAEKNFAELRKIANTLMLTFMVVTAVAYIFLKCFSTSIISLIFGDKYLYASTVLPYYAVGISLLSMVIFLGNVMIAFKKNNSFLLLLFGALIAYAPLVAFLYKSVELLAPPFALTSISLLCIVGLIYMINRSEEPIVDVKKVLLISLWLLSLGFLSQFVYQYVIIFLNYYLVGGIVFLGFVLICLSPLKDLRNSLINSGLLILRKKLW